jgi:hypothetical protein
LIGSLKKYCFSLFLLFAAVNGVAQFFIKGTVYDSSKYIPVKDVIVKNTDGGMTKTDSLGHYSIVVKDNDSISFIYHNKPTEKYAVQQIKDLENFDISLHIRIPQKFRTLQEVRVYSRSYQEDSMENRQEYSRDFGFEKPGIGSTMSSYSGAAGLDLDEFIHIFNFRKNKLEASFQKRLVEQEQDKYIDYRFNKQLVKRITKITSPELDTFMIKYRPTFEFTQLSSTAEFYQYILDASYQFKNDQLQKKKEEQAN